jgi:hypothetical protein
LYDNWQYWRNLRALTTAFFFSISWGGVALDIRNYLSGSSMEKRLGNTDPGYCLSVRNVVSRIIRVPLLQLPFRTVRIPESLSAWTGTESLQCRDNTNAFSYWFVYWISRRQVLLVSASDGERPGHPEITSTQNYVTKQMVYKCQYAERWTQCFLSCVFVDHRVQLAGNVLLRVGWEGREGGGQIAWL